jgi:hypothetical protein
MSEMEQNVESAETVEEVRAVGDGTSPKNIYQRLLQVMAAAGDVVKERGRGVDFPFHKIDGIVGALQPALIAAGVWMQLDLVSLTREDRTNANNKAYEVSTAVIDVTFVNVDDPKDVDGPHRVEGQGWDYSDKADGKAWSYALKPFLLATFNLRGAPDNEDDDIQGAGRDAGRATSFGGDAGSDGREYPSARAARAVRSLAEKGDTLSVEQAWNRMAAAVKDLDDDTGKLHADKVDALYRDALAAQGWTQPAVVSRLKALTSLLPSAVPWKAGEAVMAAFTSIPGRPATASKVSMSWEETWDRVRKELDAVDSEVESLDAFVGAMEEFHQRLRKAGWDIGVVSTVLREELDVEVGELPMYDQTGKSSFTRWVGRALAGTTPEEVLARYDKTDEELPSADEQPADPPRDEDSPGQRAALLDRIRLGAFPVTSDGEKPVKELELDAWERIADVAKDLAELHDVEVAVTDQNIHRLRDVLINGERDPEVVDALVLEMTGKTYDDLPDAVAPAMIRVLVAFPVLDGAS